jgi:putative oxidoreductase
MARETGTNWGTLVPRFLLATVFVYHGGQKLFGLFGAPPGMLEKMTEGIASWGWPMPGVLARAAAATEFFGGACLALGLLTRFWALGLAVVMGVAAWKVHMAKGFGLPDGFEYCFVLGILALSLVVQGGGALSMDTLFFKGGKKKEPPPEA